MLGLGSLAYANKTHKLVANLPALMKIGEITFLLVANPGAFLAEFTSPISGFLGGEWLLLRGQRIQDATRKVKPLKDPWRWVRHQYCNHILNTQSKVGKMKPKSIFIWVALFLLLLSDCKSRSLSSLARARNGNGRRNQNAESRQTTNNSQARQLVDFVVIFPQGGLMKRVHEDAIRICLDPETETLKQWLKRGTSLEELDRHSEERIAWVKAQTTAGLLAWLKVLEKVAVKPLTTKIEFGPFTEECFGSAHLKLSACSEDPGWIGPHAAVWTDPELPWFRIRCDYKHNIANSTFIHELGHAFGLGHAHPDTTIMGTALGFSGPQRGDRQGARTIYGLIHGLPEGITPEKLAEEERVAEENK